MGLQTNSWDPILLHILIKKVDRTVHIQYENSITNPKELQTIDHFLAFLEKYFHTLEAMGHKDKSSTHSGKACALTAQPHQEIRRCSICKQDSHPLYRCKEFILLSPTNRLDHAQRHKLCVNCFSSNHLTKWCNISGRCQKCGKKHHTLVHLEQSSHNTLVSTKQGKTSNKPAQITKGEQKCPIKQSTLQSTDHASSLLTTPTVEAESLTLSSVNKRPYILLGTALVKVQANDMEIECKAILDSGSQVNLITERLVARLGLPARATSISINGIGTNRTKIQHRVNITLQSRLNNFAARLEAFVLPQIVAPQPAQLLNIDKWSIPKNVTLADPTFNQPNKIDILLGAEYYHQLLAIGQIKLADDLPRLQNTLLGWIVSGKVSGQRLSTAVCGILSEDERLDMVVDRFWKLEEIESTHQQLSPVDAQCEAHFNQNTTRDKDGRFVVRLPFCTETSVLGESHSIAFNRFLSLERRLSKDAFLKEHYTKFMEEYEALGHMTKTDIDKVDKAKYFIPHHCIIRPESSSTKLRVVFDASSKTSSGKSLNDILHTGPPLQNELFTILLRFRLPRFVFTTDIEKMYRQILIHPKDRQYQVILWRKNATEPLSYFKLNIVTYETSKPSPTKRSNASRNISTGSPIPKRCNLATTTMLMLLALIFPLILCQSVIYTPITGKPGLHFEQIGKIKPIMSEWKLLVYFELAPFHNELRLLANGTDALARACESSHLDSHCHGLIHYFRDIKNEMEVGLENLSKRKKRGAIDIVGNIANSLFGVLDSKYADQMTDTINTIKSNEAYLQVMLRNQTSFLDSTLNIMKQTENRNKMNFAELNARINALQNFTTSNHIHQSQLILSISTHLIIIADNLQKTHRSMINLLADTHHGRISPVLLTPTQFSNEVDNIRANLPSDLTLPVVNIMHVYGIVTAHALMSDQHIICTMFIPLTHQTEYELFHVTPVPQLINNSLVAVTPKSTLIALNAHRDEYFPMDDTKLLECSTLEHNTYLCPKIQATYHKGAPICSCEVHLFNNESDTACNLEILADNNVWYQMYTPNQWIIATQEQLKLSTVCNGKGSYQILQGTGILTLPAECTVKTDGITIYSHRTISSSLHQFYTNSGISFSNPVHNVEHLTQPFLYQSSIADINRLQEEVKSQLRELPALANHQKTHGLVVSYTGLALVLILLLLLLSKYISKKKANRQHTAPQPAPRSSWNISVDP